MSAVTGRSLRPFRPVLFYPGHIAESPAELSKIVLMPIPQTQRFMKLEPIIQSEVSQKEKHQYSILTHIYGI